MSERAPDGMPTRLIPAHIEEAESNLRHWKWSLTGAQARVISAQTMINVLTADLEKYQSWLKIRQEEEAN